MLSTPTCGGSGQNRLRTVARGLDTTESRGRHEHGVLRPIQRAATFVPSLLLAALAAGGAVTGASQRSAGFLPGERVLLDAHNCYPYQGRWADRLDRALATGLPLAIEQDLIWRARTPSSPGHSIVSHGEPFTGSEPSLRDFFERIRPLVMRALAEPDRRDWPLVTLNLDFKDSEPQHFAAIWALLGEYESWLTTAARRTDRRPSPLEVGPVLVLTGEDPAQERAFSDNIGANDRLRLFGAVRKPDLPRDKPAESAARLALWLRGLEATNYRRWVNYPWSFVEPEGQPGAAAWTSEDQARLGRLVTRAHDGNLWIRFYTLNGVTPAESERLGWTDSYNFGNEPAVRERWGAALDAGVDFIATDQYEALAAMVTTARRAVPAAP